MGIGPRHGDRRWNKYFPLLSSSIISKLVWLYISPFPPHQCCGTSSPDTPEPTGPRNTTHTSTLLRGGPGGVGNICSIYRHMSGDQHRHQRRPPKQLTLSPSTSSTPFPRLYRSAKSLPSEYINKFFMDWKRRCDSHYEAKRALFEEGGRKRRRL